ncbi:hypothetical protein B0H10DRAFT_942068 [Mycena sp. CBHHK59/15]|nr:hypothetical protein B0H10DRAFT_942068 [Mycena sp. CBHHK59/15]
MEKIVWTPRPWFRADHPSSLHKSCRYTRLPNVSPWPEPLRLRSITTFLHLRQAHWPLIHEVNFLGSGSPLNQVHSNPTAPHLP